METQQSYTKVREMEVRLQNARNERSQAREAQKRRVAKLQEEIAEKKDEINKAEREADDLQRRVDQHRNDINWLTVDVQRKKRKNDNLRRRLDDENRRLQDLKEQLKNEQDQTREKRQKQYNDMNQRKRSSSASPSTNRVNFQNRYQTRLSNQGQGIQLSNTNEDVQPVERRTRRAQTGTEDKSKQMERDTTTNPTEVNELRKEVKRLKSKVNEKESRSRNRNRIQRPMSRDQSSPRSSGSASKSPSAMLNKRKEPIVVHFFLPTSTMNDQVVMVDNNEVEKQPIIQSLSPKASPSLPRSDRPKPAARMEDVP